MARKIWIGVLFTCLLLLVFFDLAFGVLAVTGHPKVSDFGLLAGLVSATWITSVVLKRKIDSKSHIKPGETSLAS